MRIAIISTRGIPNNYGGFEQFAEYISVGLAKKGHQVTVYTPHFHSYKNDEYKGVSLVHINSPEQWMGSAVGSFFYDYWSFKDALVNKQFDLIYVAGYTSIIPAFIKFNVKSICIPVIVTNMDGLEYKRTKFSPIVRRFIFWEEKMAVLHSKFLVSDNGGIRQYYLDKYRRDSKMLAYGANLYTDYSDNYLIPYGLVSNSYYLIIARMEPENNIDTIINGYINAAKSELPLVIIGKLNTRFAKSMLKKYSSNPLIHFLGGVYDFQALNSIRYFSRAYFHGHSVGGTNPSLLEAMASSCFIIAHNNPFNKSVLGSNALYFSKPEDVSDFLNNEQILISRNKNSFIQNNCGLISSTYSWDKLVDDYDAYFRLIADL